MYLATASGHRQVLSIVFMASNFLSGILCVKACYKNKAGSAPGLTG